MRKKVLTAAFAVAMIAGIATPLLATGAAEAVPAGKVTICHSTRSATNPFVVITVSENAKAAHGAHHDGDDIIPGEDCFGEGEEGPRD